MNESDDSRREILLIASAEKVFGGRVKLEHFQCQSLGKFLTSIEQYSVESITDKDDGSYHLSAPFA